MNISRKLSIILISALLGLFPSSGLADVTSLVNYQGKLKKNGTNENGGVSITFKIFTGETNTECVFEEAQLVSVVDGFYSTLIGRNPTLGNIEDASALDDAYLEVTVNGNTLKPRERFLPPAFAKKSSERWNAFLGRSPSSDFTTPTETTTYTTEGPFWAFFITDQMNPVYSLNRLAVFAIPSESVKITSAKIFLTSSLAAAQYPDPMPTNGLELPITLQLVAEDMVAGTNRVISTNSTVVFKFGVPDDYSKRWISLDLGTNIPTRTLQPTERLVLNSSTSYRFSSGTLPLRSSFFLDVRVK